VARIGSVPQPETALRLWRLFGNTPEFWLNAQQAIELWEAAGALKGDVARIRPRDAADAETCRQILGCKHAPARRVSSWALAFTGKAHGLRRLHARSAQQGSLGESAKPLHGSAGCPARALRAGTGLSNEAGAGGLGAFPFESCRRLHESTRVGCGPAPRASPGAEATGDRR